MLKYSKQSIRVNREMFDETKELIQALGLPIVQAPSEAEAQAAFMNEKGDVDYNEGLDCACIGNHKDIALLMIEKGANIKNCKIWLNKNDLIYLYHKGVKEFDKHKNIIETYISNKNICEYNYLNKIMQQKVILYIRQQSEKQIDHNYYNLFEVQ